jgi:hypothetical protein
MYGFVVLSFALMAVALAITGITFYAQTPSLQLNSIEKRDLLV